MDRTTAYDRVRLPEGMSGDDAVAVIDLLLSGALDAETGGNLLIAWAERGETATELAAVVTSLRQRAVQVPCAQPGIDLCGTGGTGLVRFNISTASAFILAAAGIPVAKHGNRGSKRPNGSFDLLDALGIPFELPPEALAQLQAETGVCFLFARSHHPAVGKAVPYRQAAGRRTIFNLAGPLANPAPVSHQLIGAADQRVAETVAGALAGLDLTAALVVRGEPGIDELSVAGANHLIQLAGSEATTHTWPAPTDAVAWDDLPGGDAEANATTLAALFSGELGGPLLDMVCLNAGAAIDLWHGRALSAKGAGQADARELVVSGAAQAALDAHRELARRLSA